MSKQDWEQGQAHTPNALRVASIFLTIDGEANKWHQGTWSVFVRLQGCRVGCAWCDTKHTWSIKGGELLSASQIMQRIGEVGPQIFRVTITGGEPMEQLSEPFRELLDHMHLLGYSVSMETAGTHDLRDMIEVYPEVNYIVDYKLPSAKARQPAHVDSLVKLREQDVVKFCATSLEEVNLVATLAEDLRNRGCTARLVISPVLIPSTLHSFSYYEQTLHSFVARCKEVGLPQLDVGLNIQLHKFVWTENVRDEEAALTPTHI